MHTFRHVPTMPHDDPFAGDLFSTTKASAHEDPAELARLAARLEASPDYRVLRRLQPRDSYSTLAGDVAHAVYIDLETTGLDPAAEKVIELSAVPFLYGRDTGEIGAVGRAYCSFEDPGRAIPSVVGEITGITDEMVLGRRIDDAEVLALLAPAELVIAHNAEFDRPFLERRLPAFAKARWACSMTDVDWNTGGRGLEYLLATHCGAFYDSHRAEMDCRAGIHLLATPFGDGTQPMHQLLRSASAASYKISAVGAPIEFKDMLKARRYRWFAGDRERPKTWHKTVSAAELEAERAWLTANIYGGLYEGREELMDPLRRFVE